MVSSPSHKIHSGGIKKIVQNDDLILNFGAVLLNKSGERRRHYYSSKMKQLGKLVSKVQDLNDTNLSLMDCIHPEKFDLVVQATKEVSGLVKEKTMNGFRCPEHHLLAFRLVIRWPNVL